MKKALAERIVGAELTEHLGYAAGEPKPAAQPNYRNGASPKTVLTDDDTLTLDLPRDRSGTFEPQLIPKHVRRLPGASTPRCSRCTRAGSPCARSARIWRSSTRSRSRPR